MKRMHVTADGWEDVSVVIPEVRPREGVTEEPTNQTSQQPQAGRKCQAPTGTTVKQLPEPRPEPVKQLPEPDGKA